MNNDRSYELGWPADLINIDSWRKSVARHAQPPPQPSMLHTFARTPEHSSFLLFVGPYILGQDAAAAQAAREYLTHATEYFFGRWKEVAPTGNASNQPPDPEYWHQQWNQDEPFVRAAAVSSLLGQWELVRRLASYMASIRWASLEFPNRPGLRWIDVKDGRTESAWRLALAGVIDGRDLGGELAPLAEIVASGRAKREKLLLEFLRAIIAGDDATLQGACTAYFKHHRTVESKRQDILSKVAIEGTLLVNLARQRGRAVEVPPQAGPRFIQLQPAG